MTSPELVNDARRQGYKAAYQRLVLNPHRSGDDQPLSQSFALSQAWQEGFTAGEVDRAAGVPFKE